MNTCFHRVDRAAMSQSNNNLGRRGLLPRYWSCASGFWRGKSARVSWTLTAGLLALALVQLAVQYRLNYWNRDFFNALERRDAARLWEEAWLFAPLAGLSIGLSVAAVWGRMTTQRKWLAVSRAPFEIVEQRPDKIAAHVSARLDRVEHGGRVGRPPVDSGDERLAAVHITVAVHTTRSVAAWPNALSIAAAAAAAWTSGAGTAAAKVREPTILPPSPTTLAENSTCAAGLPSGPCAIWKLRTSTTS